MEEIGHYLTNGLPQDRPLDQARARRLMRDATPYQLIAQQLYKMCKDGILQKCVSDDEFIVILEEAHSGIARGHFATDTAARKILQVGLWWPMMFGNAT